MADASTPVPYTADPLWLFIKDFGLFARNLFPWPGLFGLVIPPWTSNTGQLDELYPTLQNAWAVFQHLVLIVAQSIFLLSLLPLAVVLPAPIFYFSYIAAFIFGTRLVTVLLNGWRRRLYKSHEKYTIGRNVDPRERWVYINGVATGKHWLQANLDRLALTFRRPIYGIHNRTSGIIFDVIECIIQRDFAYATLDIRIAYAELMDMLTDEDISKVVLIVHSQGGIEGSLVLDWLYATLAAAQLAKLEIYTFGNAANHWNAPASTLSHHGHVTEGGSSAGGKQPLLTTSITQSRPWERESETRTVKHIEHYANTLDYVARGGILHFRPDPPPPGTAGSGQTTAALPSQEALDSNRFVGRLFKRTGPGHLLNQHYLDPMFQLDSSDAVRGRVLDGNEYMDQRVDQATFDRWDTVQALEGTEPQSQGVLIKDLSRLWRYRNGADADIDADVNDG
ncbi:hypothetical protein PV10_07309 [Exophiala mesophila]|uniref:DUF676 domain-containing protein n=1 Tax=Exophiala mesophila TaxID=212818 RepID=A0A0D1XPD6_EXOME|nr:uncharacterized protein PV10_07309 [Exophiala mesophila]KIV89956.1 hypothetical protein PV10_07309 [Exophiala mesophila]